MNNFSVFHHLQKDKQRKQRHSLKLGKQRGESSKRNYYIISPKMIPKAIIIIKHISWSMTILILLHVSLLRSAQTNPQIFRRFSANTNLYAGK